MFVKSTKAFGEAKDKRYSAPSKKKDKKARSHGEVRDNGLYETRG